jgi:enamine deaminase RidA (YjgF/YER057c/UK114 family)
VDGPHASEFFFNCRPPAGAAHPVEQARAVYNAIVGALQAVGGGFESVVTETVFLRDRENIEQIRSARARVLAEIGGQPHRPARTEIEQPPLTEGAHLEVLVHAIVPNKPELQLDSFEAVTNCSCSECARTHGLLAMHGAEARLYAGGLYGAGKNSYEQTHAMFEVAEKLLHQAGMEFSDVMRTWIYFPEMERDYADFNRARREFFETRSIDPVPASTGIGAGLIPAQHRVCLGIYAVKSDPATKRIVMTTPTLNEAPEYGSDFSRGMRVQEVNATRLLVSGTASLDETGETVHVDNLEGQARRMLLNVEALLNAQGAGFSDVVWAITYLKHPQDAQRLREIFQQAGYDGFPNVIVTAEVCRPELLCETELLAVVPNT